MNRRDLLKAACAMPLVGSLFRTTPARDPYWDAVVEVKNYTGVYESSASKIAAGDFSPNAVFEKARQMGRPETNWATLLLLEEILSQPPC